MTLREARKPISPLKVVNIGLQFFYDELKRQDVPVVDIRWRPPVQLEDRLKRVLEKI